MVSIFLIYPLQSMALVVVTLLLPPTLLNVDGGLVVVTPGTLVSVFSFVDL